MACDNAHEREWGDPMGELNDLLVAFTGTIDDFMYTYILVILLVATGVWFTIRTRFVQIRYIKDMFTNLVGKSVAADTEFSDDVANSVDTGKLPKAPGAANEHGSTAYADVSKPKRQRRISSFQALMVSTASRVGTGNIVGIATAIAIGGPGAVFWMWLMAIIGAASAFIESTLAQIWKVRNPDGTFRGGPAYYIQLALGKRWLGIVFAIALILCFGLGFNGLQTYNMASAIDYYVIEGHETVVNAIIGLFVVVAVAVVIFGGIHRISIITSWIVPIMAGAYILIAIWTCVSNLGDVPAALGLVFGQAFDFTSLAGGFTGSMIMWGIKRGLFSNEAGMGSAPNAAATADVSHPVKQGLVQSLSVYIDTLVICTCSALMMLIFCVQQPDTVAALVASDSFNGIDFVQMAMANSIGPIGIHFMTACIILFAFSSLVGNYFYAEGNILFIKDNKTVLLVFRLFCLVAIFFGAVNNFSLAWNLADIFMGFMAIINLVAILLLGKWALKALDDYTAQRKQGVNPVFCAQSIPGMPKTMWWTQDARCRVPASSDDAGVAGTTG